MQWIARNKNKLYLVSGVALAVALVELLIVRSRGGAFLIKPWRFGLFILPWVVGALALLPLWYLSWFGQPRRGAVVLVEKVFFWLVATGMLVGFVLLYGIFVFQLW